MINIPTQLSDDTTSIRTDNYLNVPIECAEVLNFWFGPGPEIEYNGGLWWHGIMNGSGGNNKEECKKMTDDYVRDNFAKIIISDVKSWLETPLGAVGAIVLYDQLPRHAFRGTAEAFKYDSHAYELASKMLKEQPDLFSSPTEGLVGNNNSNVLPWTYQIFVYFALIHSENINICAEGSSGLVNLQQNLRDLEATSTDSDVKKLASHAAHKLVSLLRSAKQHLQMLSQFGRYPHRNQALNRTSTNDEIQFMEQKDRPNWTKSQMANKFAEDVPLQLSKKAFRVLVLHSNRQSPFIFQKRTKAILSKMVGPGSTLVYASAPHKYVAQGEAKLNSKHVQASEADSTRCWWNASDDPETMIYTGIEESIQYVDQVAQTNGPFDGIIGFSQGGTLAGVIAALVSDKSPRVQNIAKTLQFTVIISGFYIRDVRPEFVNLNGPKRDKGNPINIPSFHVWGLNDTLVYPERSQALKDSFADSIPRMEVPHKLDHFAKAIGVWPYAEINKWINTYFTQRDLSALTNDLYGKLIATKDPRYKPDYDMGQLLECGVLNSDNTTNLDDILSFSMAILHSKDPRMVIANDVNIEMVDKTIFQPKNLNMLHSANLLVRIGKGFGNSVDWLAKMRVILSVYPNAISSFYHADKSVKVFRSSIVTIVTESIIMSLEQKRCDFISETLPARSNKTFIKYGLMGDIIKNLGDYLPKFGLSIIKKANNEIDVIDTYDKLLGLLSKYVVNPDRDGVLKHEMKVKKGSRNPDNLQELLAAPLHDTVVNPTPEPVEVATYQEMQHLHEYLRGIQQCAGDQTEGQRVFPKGALCADGRLDLCKQVIGPNGVLDLEKSLVIDGTSGDPKVKSLLLGNNIAGSKLGEAVSRMIKNKSTNIKIWYIAGNNLDAEGISPVMEALEHDQYVEQLWLKRNPLKIPGGFAMQKMLSVNNYLKVLDLTNVGLLDEGVAAVCSAISSNPHSTLSVLYLSSNGMRCKGLTHVISMLKVRKMYQIGLACNRLGDEGASMLCEVLDRIEDLELSSCGIGYKGVEAISAVLAGNTTLKVLDLGFLKSTNALFEVPNAMGNKGAVALAGALKKNRTLVSLDVLHNGIYQVGVVALAEALTGENENGTLLHLNIEQLGIPHNELTRETIRSSLKKNMAKLNDDEKKTAMSYLSPPHLEIIRSVYRVERI